MEKQASNGDTLDKKKRLNLTDKQEGFAVSFVMNEDNQTEAYRTHYNTENMKDTTIWVEAHKLRNNPKVARRIDELRKLQIDDRVLTINERKSLLSKWSMSGDTKALDLLNKMEGVYVEKVEQKVTGSSTVVNIVEDKRDE